MIKVTQLVRGKVYNICIIITFFLLIVNCILPKADHFNHFKVHISRALSTFATFHLQNFLISPTETVYSLGTHSPRPSTPGSGDYQFALSLSLWICLFWTFLINGATQYVASCVWLISLSIMTKTFIHTVACVSGTFLIS